ncbi:hypothetical protein ACLM5J_08900 [Nocardioides sp. Bht2]|uniref:hypothetical protein n=1 Tax=Nocardioides sp. Bht2 TaxID=3392297 RepID=UPI0039B63AB8
MSTIKNLWTNERLVMPICAASYARTTQASAVATTQAPAGRVRVAAAHAAAGADFGATPGTHLWRPPSR